MIDARCKICRRLGVKLFLKGERCLSTKCPMIKRPYPPGEKGKRRRRSFSEFGKELREKQKLRVIYNLGEGQFGNYIKGLLKRKGGIEDISTALIKILELRLDSVVFRLGFASSMSQARQLVSHGFFSVNGRPVNIPSYRLRKGDVISLKKQKTKKAIFKNLKSILKKKEIPSWLKLDIEKLEGRVVGQPVLDEVSPPVEIPTIFEYYSR